MLFGYINKQQDIVDLINNCLINKNGLLNIFSNNSSISLYIEKGYIKGFFSPALEGLSENVKNRTSMLFYYLFETLENPEGFFSFSQNEKESLILLEKPINAEELVLQLHLISHKLKALMDKIITPYAVLKVQEKFEDMETFDGKSLYQILYSTEGDMAELLQRVESLISNGFLDIHQFYNPEVDKRKFVIEYLVKDVESSKINLITIIENLQLSRFTGFLRAVKGINEFEIFYVKGKPIGVYPLNCNIFEFFMNQDASTNVSVISMDAPALNLYMLKYAENWWIKGVGSEFLELGKLIMGIEQSKSTGLLLVHMPSKETYILFDEGKIRGVMEEAEGYLKASTHLKAERPFWVDMAPYEPMENISSTIYLFLINIVYGVLFKHLGYNAEHNLLSYVASSDLFEYDEGSIKYRRKPREEDEVIVGLLSLLLDTGHKVLGQKRLEESIEALLQPYRETFKIMDLEEYIRFPNENPTR
ncbi:MAG: hypothetical protein ACK4SM_00175 [Aquificaceae bacterium]